MSTKKYDCLIVGGGIVGLATAWNLLESNPDLKIVVLEKEDRIASHQTGHNSGVIHSGIYYKPGSLKAQNCIRGYKMLLDFAQKHNIRHELCGKVIVATEEWELPLLDNVFQRGIENGLVENKMLSAVELREIEPHCRGLKAIKVPYTGIIDYKEVAAKLAELIQAKGGEIITGCKVSGILENNGETIALTSKGEFVCRLLINCAGLFSDKIAALTEKELNVKIIPFRGEYYELKKSKESLVKHLIYPVPDPNFPFLGVHFTRMIGGGVEAGPNAVFAFKREGYTRTSFKLNEVMESLAWPGFRKVAGKYWKTGLGEYYRSFSKSAFTRALRKLIPEVNQEDLVPAGAGVRAQACDKQGGLIDDFLFLEKKSVIHVLNAPSPAATSSLSIGKTISEMAVSKL